MGINISIRIDLTAMQKRIIRAAVVTGAVVAALGVGIAVGAPHQWKTSDALTATDLNGLSRLTSADGGVTYSVAATAVCGSTASTTGNFSALNTGKTGYASAKKACESACGGSATAHMCFADEVIRSSALGVNMTGWYASGGSSVGTSTGGECVGFTSADSANYGLVWNNGGPYPYLFACSTSLPVLCCD